MTKFLLALPVALGLASMATAQTAPTKVGVIQIQAALANTRDGKAALDGMEAKFMAPKRKEIEGKQAELKDLQDQLQRGANTLSQARKDDLQRSIDIKTKNLNRDIEDAQAEVESEQRKVVDDLSARMFPMIEKYAQENGFAMVIDVSNPNSGVLWAATGIDITQAIVDLYDKSAPAAPTAAPAKAAAPAATPAKPAAPKPAPAK